MLFDIRTIVGSLLGLYGIILVITGLVNDTVDEEAKTGGINVNLWAGLVLVAVAAAFVAWALLRPVAVDRPDRESPPDGTAAGTD
ncbi:hypothetical protein [Nocardia testacea]|uniref:hypothetical protein n=1 Tax=Nocardia testacea TaxID=248551 RepID=UPI0002ED0FD8|nr:hypothetical protein [Nocardia testacea]